MVEEVAPLFGDDQMTSLLFHLVLFNMYKIFLLF